MNLLFLQREAKCEVVQGQLRWHLRAEADKNECLLWGKLAYGSNLLSCL